MADINTFGATRYSTSRTQRLSDGRIEDMKTWTQLVDDTKPMPGGLIGRTVPVVLALVMYGTDVLMDGTTYVSNPGLLLLAAPFMSLAALSLGVLPSVFVWYVSAILIGLAGLPGILVFGMIFPSVIVMAVCCCLLPWKFALLFPISSIALALGLFLLSPGTHVVPTLLLVLLCSLAAVAGLSLNMYRRRHERSSVQIRNLEQEQARIRSEERTLLAHELHDIVAHDVTVIAMQARRAEFVDDPTKTARILEGIGDAAQQTLQDLRSLVMLLKQELVVPVPVPLQGRNDDVEILGTAAMSGETTTAVGFVNDLDRVVEALRRADFEVVLQVEGDVAKIPASLRQVLRRTIRELGTNVLKHASVSGTVLVHLVIGDDTVMLKAENEVSSGNPIISSHTGLEAMIARCEIFGGFVDSGLTAERWSTFVTIPLVGLPLPRR